MISARLSRCSAPALAAALILGATGPRAVAAQAARDSANGPVQQVWPLPPDPARVRYIAVYGTDEDIQGPRKSRVFSLKETLLGKARMAREKPRARALGKPFGVAVDSRHRILVTDPEQATLVVMDPGQKGYTTVGARGQTSASFRVPIGVAVDAQDRIYVGDNGHRQILVFGPDLTFQRTIGAGDLEAPSGLAVDSARNRLYVVDTRRHSLTVYDVTTGARVARIGKLGAANGEFGYPTGVAVGPDGCVYVADTLNYRVQVFDPDLKFLRAFGSLGVAPGQFRRPKGIAVDALNAVYVVDSDFNNFQMFAPDGQPLLAVGSRGERPGQLLLPAGIAVDRKSGRVVVAEQLNRRVQVFERVLGAGERPLMPQ